MSDCNHLRLKKVKVAEVLYYQCETCGQNFRLPEPLVIGVKYPAVTA